MKKIAAVVAVVFAASTISLLYFFKDSRTGLRVPAKVIPVPSTVSPELQERIAVPVPPIPSLPTTAEGWKKLQQGIDEGAAKAAVNLAESVGATVESTEIAGVPCFRITPKTVLPENEDCLIYHVHGGAFVFHGGIAATHEAVLLADACKMKVLSVDYRRPPDYRFPAATDDILAVWKEIVKSHDPAKIAIGGSSAGGGLVMTHVHRCKSEHLPLPAAVFVGTPGADLTKTGDSLYVNAEVDHTLSRYEGKMEACIKQYAGEHDLKDPLLSPIYGDFTGWPPTILITGTRDVLLSATSLTHRKLRAAGVPADLHVYEGMSHSDYLAAIDAPESKDVMKEVADFFQQYLHK